MGVVDELEELKRILEGVYPSNPIDVNLLKSARERVEGLIERFKNVKKDTGMVEADGSGV